MEPVGDCAVARRLHAVVAMGQRVRTAISATVEQAGKGQQ